MRLRIPLRNQARVALPAAAASLSVVLVLLMRLIVISPITVHAGKPVTVPGAPTNVTAVPGNTQASVSWSPPASDGGSAITSYTVTPFVGSTAGTPVPVGASTTSTNVSGLTNGTTYTFQVTATNSVGTGPAGTSNAVTVGAPTPPTGVTAVAAANQATVSWTASSPNASAVTGYVLTASTSGLAQNAVGVSGTTTSNVVLTGLAGGTSYTFQVVASNSFGNSPPSAASAPVTPSGSTTTYASTVLGDGPVVYYRLGDPSGSVAADSSGSGRNGSYEGSVSLGSGSALVNDSNPSFSLGNGSDLRYRLATGLPTGNGARSVEAWINTSPRPM